MQLNDSNIIASLVYAATGIKNSNGEHTVKEIWVVGHTDCGGVKAALAIAGGKEIPVDPAVLRWVDNLKTLAQRQNINDQADLATANVKVQVGNVISALKLLGPEVWSRITVLGYLYHVDTEDLVQIVGPLQVDPASLEKGEE